MKECKKCSQIKDLSLFHKDKSRKDGHEAVCARCSKNRSLVKYFGITIDDYERLFLEQDSKCAICGSSYLNRVGDKLAVDHDHTTGRVRGLLCVNCNLGLGCFKDNVLFLRKALKYLS